MSDSPQQVFTVAEAAKILRVSTWALYEAIKRGEIKVLRVGRTIRIPRSVVEEMTGSAREQRDRMIQSVMEEMARRTMERRRSHDTPPPTSD